MLFSNPVIIIYLKRNSLEVYSQKTRGVQARLDFPPNYEKDQEIIDLEKFEQLISNFLSKLSLNGKKVIIVISSENLFEKTIPLSDKTKEETAAKKFFEEIPFDLQKIAKKQIRTKNGLNLIAANKNFYDSIVHVLQKLQVEIRAAVPSTMFGITASTLTSEDIKKISSNPEMLKTSDFLSIDTQKKQDRETQPEKENLQADGEKSKFNPATVAGIAFIVVGLGVVVFLLFKQGILKQYLPFNKKPLPTLAPSPQESKPAPVDLENKEATEQAELSSKQDITIQILNGSGVSGQASQVQALLEQLDYSQIETGNANSQNLTTTKIVYKQNVADSLISEIKTELEKTLANVETEQTSDDIGFDIVITTGPAG